MKVSIRYMQVSVGYMKVSIRYMQVSVGYMNESLAHMHRHFSFSASVFSFSRRPRSYQPGVGKGCSLECGGKRSATPLWMSKPWTLKRKPKRRHRSALPAHSIFRSAFPTCRNENRYNPSNYELNQNISGR